MLFQLKIIDQVLINSLALVKVFAEIYSQTNSTILRSFFTVNLNFSYLSQKSPFPCIPFLHSSHLQCSPHSNPAW